MRVAASDAASNKKEKGGEPDQMEDKREKILNLAPSRVSRPRKLEIIPDKVQKHVFTSLGHPTTCKTSKHNTYRSHGHISATPLTPFRKIFITWRRHRARSRETPHRQRIVAGTFHFVLLCSVFVPSYEENPSLDIFLSHHCHSYLPVLRPTS